MNLQAILLLVLVETLPIYVHCVKAFTATSIGLLQTAIDECLAMERFGDCSNGTRGPIGEWDVSRIKEMRSMFEVPAAEYFNQSLSGWDVSQVTDMESMFAGLVLFNASLIMWDVSRVETTRGTFSAAEYYNNELSGWNVSNVRNMGFMFYSAERYNQSLSTWDVSRVTDMQAMFARAKAFNQDLSMWNVFRVKTMQQMFDAAESFNRDLSIWDMSRVSDMDHMFYGAKAFNHILCGEEWVKKLNSKTYQEEMFTNSKGSISKTACLVFRPKARDEFMERLKKCLRLPDDIPAGGYTHDGKVGGYIPYGKHEEGDTHTYDGKNKYKGFTVYDVPDPDFLPDPDYYQIQT